MLLSASTHKFYSHHQEFLIYLNQPVRFLRIERYDVEGSIDECFIYLKTEGVLQLDIIENHVSFNYSECAWSDSIEFKAFTDSMSDASFIEEEDLKLLLPLAVVEPIEDPFNNI